MNVARNIAQQLEEHISHNALAGRELKSLAKSIGYRLSIFKPLKKLRLTNELVFVNSFLGSVALRLSSQQYPLISENETEEMVEQYVSKLLSRWLAPSMHREYEDRLEIWKGLFEDLSDDVRYQRHLRIFTDIFYVGLTEKALDKHSELMLTARFNGYMKLYLQSVALLMDQHYSKCNG